MRNEQNQEHVGLGTCSAQLAGLLTPCAGELGGWWKCRERRDAKSAVRLPPLISPAISRRGDRYCEMN